MAGLVLPRYLKGQIDRQMLTSYSLMHGKIFPRAIFLPALKMPSEFAVAYAV